MPDTQTLKNQLSVADIVSPGNFEVDFNLLKLNQTLYRTFYVSGYPRFVEPNWLEPLISFEHSLAISMFIYPTSSAGVLNDLKKKIAEMEATIQSDIERTRPVDPSVTVALEDARGLQEQLVKGAERFFQYSLYIRVPAESLDEQNNISQLVQSTLGSISITVRPAILQMAEGFTTTLPLGQDLLYVPHNMDTTSLATTFPFTSSELMSPTGIIYGINEHNESLIIHDRFGQENANAVVLATSGSGKSYLVKLETLRLLMLGTEVIIIDPEREYKTLSDAVGGDYVNFSTSSQVRINPFDLPSVAASEENEIGKKILSLTAFLKLVLGELNAQEAAILDRALSLTYQQKGFSLQTGHQKMAANLEPPLMEDLYKVLLGMEDASSASIAVRLERFIKGSLAGIFSSPSNIELKKQLTVFSVRDLPDQLRPLAMHLILDYIWTKIRSGLKRRVLVVDEAWYLMKFPDSAAFLVEIVKRARKYFLGVTTISQDVEDFLSQDRGKEIVSNSSMQILLKQAPVSIEMIGQVFNMSYGEKRLLLSAGVGQGLFFAGNTHVAIRVVASDDENQLITTKPQEVSQAQFSQGQTPYS